MVSNVVTGRNRYIIVNAIQISIEFWFLSLKIWFLKKEDLIKNDDIKPDWFAIKCTKLWKRRKPTEINRWLILWQANKFHEHEVTKTNIYKIISKYVNLSRKGLRMSWSLRRLRHQTLVVNWISWNELSIFGKVFVKDEFT